MASIQSVMDLARLDMNDAEKTRNPDPVLLQYANDGIAQIKVMRPDLNWGNYTISYADLSATDPFPFALEYRPALANYIVMRAEASDDEFAVEQRAIQGMKLYLKDLGLG